MDKILNAVDIYRQSIIGRGPRDSKLTRPLLWACEEMVKEGYSITRMAKKLKVSRRSILRWKAQGRDEGEGLPYELYQILESKPAEVAVGFVGQEQTKDEGSFEDVLFRVKANREKEVERIDSIRLDELADRIYLYDGENWEIIE
jgi:hypothetical protein